MKRQAAEKRGLWGQVFGVVRIAAQGKRNGIFRCPACTAYSLFRAADRKRYRTRRDICQGLQENAETGGTIWNGCDRNTLQNAAIFPLAASAAVWNPHWNDTGKLFSDLLLQCGNAD